MVHVLYVPSNYNIQSVKSIVCKNLKYNQIPYLKYFFSLFILYSLPTFDLNRDRTSEFIDELAERAAVLYSSTALAIASADDKRIRENS